VSNYKSSVRVALAACSNGADVVFALDASDSIGFDNFQRVTQFVGMVVQTLDIDSVTNGPTISRVGLITYSDNAVVQFHLNRYTTKAALLQAVNVLYLTGSTNAAHAIRFNVIIRYYRECYTLLLIGIQQVLFYCWNSCIWPILFFSILELKVFRTWFTVTPVAYAGYSFVAHSHSHSRSKV